MLKSSFTPFKPNTFKYNLEVFTVRFLKGRSFSGIFKSLRYLGVLYKADSSAYVEVVSFHHGCLSGIDHVG